MSDAFWTHVVNGTDGCWIWEGPRLDGYGIHSVGRGSISAHRFAYVELVGEIPSGLELDHLCRVRSCVNPWHLDPVPHRINMSRSPLLGHGNGRKTHCKIGHEFTPENTRIAKQSGGRGMARVCRACTRERSQRYRREA